ncbi:MAG: serine/threonine-protein kinase [Myxococcota bacterium]|nr:serine/threonine-protein kinase [Myxococcota bacterium]
MSGNEKSREFQFLKEIAAGGFGSVYLTKISHPDGFSRLTAVKLLHRRWSDNEEISRRMRDEARLLGWLRHRHIVDVVDLTSLDGRTAIIMEYLEAVDLKQVIRASMESGERVPQRACFQIMMAAASALDAAFNRPPYAGEKPLRVIHRDIKPSNIMVDDSGHVKVLDFGVARADFAERESHTRELQFGSIDYMPPERLMFEPESPGSDVYSLGATIYELLGNEKLGKAKGSPVKHEAFVAERIEGLRERAGLQGPVGDTIAELIRETLQYEPSERPGAAQVMSRCRLLGREIPGLGLSEWAESRVPILLNEASLEEPTSMNPLTGRTFFEDSVGYLGPPAKTQDLEMPVAEGTVSDDDPRWELLRAAAAAEVGVGLGTKSTADETRALAEDEKPGNRWPEDPAQPSEVDVPEPQVESEPGDEEEKDETVTTTDEGLGFSLSARMTLGGKTTEEDEEDYDEAATTMMPIPQRVDEDELDATAMFEGPPIANEPPEPQVDEPEFEELDDGATRILTLEEDAAVSQASAQLRKDEEAAVPAAAAEENNAGDLGEDLGGATMMLSDDTANLLGSEAVLGRSGPLEESLPDAPPMMENSSLGAETILSHSGGGQSIGGAPTGTETVSTGKRVMVSLLIFLLALGAGLGLGSALFYEELYGENGALTKLLAGETSGTSVEASEVVLPGPLGGPPADAEAPIQAPAELGTPADESRAADEGMLTVVSLAEGTKSLVVRCEGRKQYKGDAEVSFVLGSHQACTITAVTSDQRLRVKATALQPGTLRCFSAGAQTCE